MLDSGSLAIIEYFNILLQCFAYNKKKAGLENTSNPTSFSSYHYSVHKSSNWTTNITSMQCTLSEDGIHMFFQNYTSIHKHILHIFIFMMIFFQKLYKNYWKLQTLLHICRRMNQIFIKLNLENICQIKSQYVSVCLYMYMYMFM